MNQHTGKGLYDPQFEHDACGIGFIVNIKGEKSQKIIEQGLTVLKNLHHRGATGSDADTGDGAGILLQIPHDFLKKECSKEGFELPEPNNYGVGMVFLPPDPVLRKEFQEKLEDIVRLEGQHVLGWRTVPTDDTTLGPVAKSNAPFVRQIFIEKSADLKDELSFERKLYVIRKSASKKIKNSGILGSEYYYVSSMSHRVIVYKGMLTAMQISSFFPELKDSLMKSAIVLVHSRFSTNTFPSWERAHPYRYIIHNGEINTLRGNVNWFQAREKIFKSGELGENLSKVIPVLDDTGSDSSILDNCLEFLVMSGRPIEQAIMMMVPEPWQADPRMDEEKRAFYEYNSCLMEPWDGPAAIGFTDGLKVGAILDRNGLRPGRYYVTKDDLVILASEVGVLDIPEDRIIKKGRLRPGKMLLIDTVEQRIVSDWEVKSRLAKEKPYSKWIKENIVRLNEQPKPLMLPKRDKEAVLRTQKVFGYTLEDLQMIISPMAVNGIEPIGSMGNDIPLAVLSDKSCLLYDYFKQLFAQVTNPPVDAIREEIVMASGTGIGPEGDLLEPGPSSCRQVHMDTAILSNQDLAKIRHIEKADFKSRTLSILFDATEQNCGASLKKAMDELCDKAVKAVNDGVEILILSDRDVSDKMVPIPALLAVSGVHHHLINLGLRTKVGVVLESGEPREVHHFATLIGYGASGINPYLVFETVEDMIEEGFIKNINLEKASKNIVKALAKGVIKTISKMGISTVESYCGAKTFEAIGIKYSVVDKYFCGTPNRIEGIGLDEIARETLMRFNNAYHSNSKSGGLTEIGGRYKWREKGEVHQYNPDTILTAQRACWTNDYNEFKKFSSLVNDENIKHKTLRGLMTFKKGRKSVPIDKVESVDSIVKRFKTGAMSYGSISQEAHECLALAMNALGARSNSGEGGEDPDRYIIGADGSSKSSAIKQVASGRFGVTSEYLVNAKELQIKVAQGAKPGEGGQLPGHKVFPWIAKVRHSTPSVELISPPPHHDIYSIEDLAQLIHDLKNANPKAGISVKLVSSAGVGTIAAGVAKASANLVLISGYDGGTGAAPLSSIKCAGIPWELGLADAHQTLVLNNLRKRIIVEVDGQLKTGRDIVIGAILGAEEFGFGTLPLVALGCNMMRVCHLNTCPVGVATQNPELRKNFRGKAEYVVNLMKFLAQEVREIMAELGIEKFDDLVGNTDLLTQRHDVIHWKAKGVDLSKILYKVDSEGLGRRYLTARNYQFKPTMDQTKLFDLCKPALEKGEKVEATLKIENTDRVVGTMLGSEISKKYGSKGLPEDTIKLNFKGSAGQSFGAFAPSGLSLFLEGDANDYIGKGLSGGKIAVFPSSESEIISHENVIIGNVAFFGATSGEAYINGLAGERFCVRNSGVQVVVEGIGDHGCEYMTGGRVIILGAGLGKNFAAGMSGGIAYVFDEEELLPQKCNRELVDLEPVDNSDTAYIRSMLEKHVLYTGSQRAKQILNNWQAKAPRFVKVMPRDYKRAIQQLKKQKETENGQANGIYGI